MSNKKRRCQICKKCFVPTFDTNTVIQTVCSNKCCLAYYAQVLNKSKKTARLCAAQVGRRSMGEVQFEYEYLERKKARSTYESDCFEYHVDEVKKYTPDWTVVVKEPTATRSSKVVYIEYKGVLDKVTRKKMLLVKKQHPALDIRIVFQRGKNKIYKGSKTTYMMWAKQHGFICADNEVPKSWFK